MSAPKFRFGVVNRSAPTRADWRAQAAKVADLGYSSFLISEHFLGQFAMGPALVAAADAAPSLRVGSMVCDVDFRHPALLAKEAATIDVLTDGRFELGLGAGWMVSDYAQTGIRFDPPPVRFERFRETVHILKGLFADGPLTFHGKQFTIDGLEGLPKPAQKPHMPLLAGAGGPGMLRFAARELDVISILMQSLPDGGLDWANATPAEFDRKVQVVREARDDRRPEINILMQKTIVTNDPRLAAQEWSKAWGIPTEAVLDCPLTLLGTPEQMVDELEAARARWDASYICVFAEATEAFAPVVARLTGR
ncbi:MAG TPA: TIGR03621 family F420-dependent LLM class oxidoreductase [Chloroflexota bacterium]|nr:TIGR03621 family F420-dependent LLM class oxidoreductase [Chloroflexota bacterium]